MKSVLIVEDDDLTRRMLCDAATASGYAVRSAADGAEAIAEVQRALPDIVLLDIGLPKVDGFGVLAAIRATPGGGALPVVAVTASAIGPNRTRIQQASFTALVEKPVRLKELADVLARHA